MSGVHAPHYKNTTNSIRVRIPAPKLVRLPMNMAFGAPSKVTVAVGDLVKVGQPIGEPGGFVSAYTHATVSGKVTAIEDFVSFNGGKTQCVVIENDFNMTPWEGVKPPVITDSASFVEAIKQSGLIGLGGAGFPAHVKFAVKDPKVVDYILINGAECEPYITSDARTMTEDTDYVFKGAELIRKYVGTPDTQIILCVEDNKPDQIAIFKARENEIPNFRVEAMPSIYPQGGEKVQVYNVTGRIVPEGGLPLDVGCIVSNVTSVAFVAKYVETGMPLVDKSFTVDGSAVKKPGNYMAPIGTPIKDILDFVERKAEVKKILYGGPMMGFAALNEEQPLLKNNNAILAFDEKDARTPAPTPCINCGRCVDACPLNLMPNRMAKAYEQRNLEALKRLHIMHCMECGCCTFVCPAKRELGMSHKLAKAFVKENTPKK